MRCDRTFKIPRLRYARWMCNGDVAVRIEARIGSLTLANHELCRECATKVGQTYKLNPEVRVAFHPLTLSPEAHG